MSGTTYAILLFFILSLAGHATYTIWKIKKHLHILQLNSYFNERYLDWAIKKRSQVFALKDLNPLVAILGMFFLYSGRVFGSFFIDLFPTIFKSSRYP
jgi:Golgi nucleoside diphosphatase